MFGRRIPLFRVFGFDVGVDTSWTLLAFLITWSLAVGVFPSYLPNLAPGAYWIMGLFGSVGLFASVLLHELSHSAVARAYGLPVRGITLFLFGGVAQMEREPEDPKVELRMAGIGPIVSLVLALLFYGAVTLGRTLAWPFTVMGVLGYLSYINLILAAFNLVPAFPLDGGRMLRAALWHWKGDLIEATRLASRLGNMFGWALILFGGVGFLRGNFLGGMWWVLIGMFLKGAAQISYRQVMIGRALEGETIQKFPMANPITVPPETPIQDFVDNYLFRYHHKLYPVAKDSRLMGCIQSKDLRAVPLAEWKTRTVGDLVSRCGPQNTISPNTSAKEALRIMTTTGNSRLMVADGEKLYGIITLKDLMRSVSLRLELSGYGSDAHWEDWSERRSA